MVNFEALYFKLFAAMADATELLAGGRSADAKARLICAMQEAEEQYLQETEA